MKRYTIGIDFGTQSGRALLLDAESGEAVASSVLAYRHGVMDRTLPSGRPLPPQFALQHPMDYVEVLQKAIPALLQKSGIGAEEVVGVGVDFTTCTMLPVDAEGTPLCLDPRFFDQPHAYVKLWKHHAAQPEADRINALAAERGETWLSRYGGRVSSEWAIPKICETLNHAPEVFDAAARFCDAGDWISLVLTGEESHAAGFAGLKYLWDAEEGFPANEFFAALDPRLSGLVGTKLCSTVRRVDRIAGVLSQRGAALTGLRQGTPLALPVPDAEAALPALNITDPSVGLLIIGTSGVQLFHSAKKNDVAGVCGYVRDGVIPTLYTYEAGQAGVGDAFEWFVRTAVPADYTNAARERGVGIHQYLREKAKCLRVGESGLLALDWLNGNRSVLQDAELSGMLLGLTLSTRPEEIYRALIESTAFGVRRILDAYQSGGLSCERLCASGGIARKDDMLMQIYADVLGRDIEVAESEQGAAHGSAIYAAVAAGLYPTVTEAAEALAVKRFITYRPIPENVKAYQRLYEEYIRLYEYFGCGGNDVMKRLRAMQTPTANI